MSREEQMQKFTAYRIRLLPEQLERAYRRVEHLEREAIRLGMADLVRKINA